MQSRPEFIPVTLKIMGSAAVPRDPMKRPSYVFVIYQAWINKI